MIEIVDQHWGCEQKPFNFINEIESFARTAYQSMISKNRLDSEKFIINLIKKGHESVLEHCAISLRIITNRGISHEMVRHRLASFTQESTRFCAYKNIMKFIKPVWLDIDIGIYDLKKISDVSGIEEKIFLMACYNSANSYLELRKSGASPEKAREVLPNALKTELIMTANIREWRHILKLRTSKYAHPQMKDLMDSILEFFRIDFKPCFDDIS